MEVVGSVDSGNELSILGTGNRSGADPQVRRQRPALHVLSDRGSLCRGLRRGGPTRHWLRQTQHRRHQAAAFAVRAPAVLRHDLLLLRVQQGRDARPRTLREVYQVPRQGTRRCCRDCWAPNARFRQMHWGGGTPTFLSRDEMARTDVRVLRAIRASRRLRVLRSRSIRARSSPARCDFSPNSASTAFRSACRTSIRRCRRR